MVQSQNHIELGLSNGFLYVISWVTWKFYECRSISNYTKSFQIFDDTIDEHGHHGSRGIGKAISYAFKSIGIDVFAASKNNIYTSNLNSVKKLEEHTQTDVLILNICGSPPKQFSTITEEIGNFVKSTVKNDIKYLSGVTIRFDDINSN